ncbi:MAG: 2-vinyl bacteriochlorophyllide hydratase [Steroidobacteraceae bacterium]
MALYTPEQRLRRDASRWTLVQGVLAPVQFLVFLVSAALVLRFLLTGEDLAAATISVVIKTLVLYTIMITGCAWERDVFGRYLFASAFFWEDFVSMFVLALHTAYLGALLFGRLHARYQMYLALLAYSAYLLNATQFLIKLRAARLEGTPAYGVSPLTTETARRAAVPGLIT